MQFILITIILPLSNWLFSLFWLFMKWFYTLNVGMTGPRGRTGRPGINGTPGIPGINAWKVKVNGTFSDQYLIPPAIAGILLLDNENLK